MWKIEKCHECWNANTREELDMGSDRLMKRKKTRRVQVSVHNKVQDKWDNWEYKARLVVKSYIQIYEIDYQEIFVLVTKVI